MIYLYRHILAVLLVAVKLCAPLMGQVYFSESVRTTETSNIEAVCVQDRGVSGVSSHESQENPQRIIQCHELKQPGLIASELSIHFTPAVSTLALSDIDARLPGYRFPLKIPPKYPV